MLSISLPVFCLIQHTDYHQQLGFTGAILLVTRPVAAQLISHPALQPGLQAGAFFIILWVSEGRYIGKCLGVLTWQQLGGEVGAGRCSQQCGLHWSCPPLSAVGGMKLIQQCLKRVWQLP